MQQDPFYVSGFGMCIPSSCSNDDALILLGNRFVFFFPSNHHLNIIVIQIGNAQNKEVHLYRCFIASL